MDLGAVKPALFFCAKAECAPDMPLYALLMFPNAPHPWLQSIISPNLTST
jgi:hypothetical protein